MLACFRGNSEVIKLLIKGGAGTHSRDRVNNFLSLSVSLIHLCLCGAFFLSSCHVLSY